MKPELSILMAVRNGAGYLRSTLNAISLEMRGGLELIAVDDGSTDESFSLLQDVPWVNKAIRSPGRGLAAARNAALAEARGKYITFFDQDDLICPGAFHHRLAYLKNHPSAVAVAGRVDVAIDSRGDSLGSFERLTGKEFKAGVLDWKAVEEGRLPGALWIYIFRTDFINRVGRFEARWDELTDQEFLYRALKIAQIPRLDIPVAKYRIHGTNSTVGFREGQITAKTRVRALGALLAIHYGL